MTDSVVAANVAGQSGGGVDCSLLAEFYSSGVSLSRNTAVRGGGLTGQCEACVPAIAKALQNYDVATRPILKYLRLLRNDPRRVERKKPGLQKARKG